MLGKEEPGTALLYSFFRKVNPRKWIEKSNEDPDSTFLAIENLNLTFNEPDSLSFAAIGNGQWYIDAFTARKFLLADRLEFSDEPVYLQKIPLQKYAVYARQNLNESEYAFLYFSNGSKMIGAVQIAPGNGISYFSKLISQDTTLFGVKNDFGSANGMVWKEWFIYNITPAGIVPVRHFPAEVNDAIPMDICRFKEYEITLTDTALLSFRLHLKTSIMAHGDELPLLNNTFYFSLEDSLSFIPASLYNTYFTEDVDKVFIHQYRTALLQVYVSSTADKRRLMRSYLDCVLKKK